MKILRRRAEKRRRETNRLRDQRILVLGAVAALGFGFCWAVREYEKNDDD